MVVIVTINRTMGQKVLIMFGCITRCNLCIKVAATHSLQREREINEDTKNTHTGLRGLRGTGRQSRAGW